MVTFSKRLTQNSAVDSPDYCDSGSVFLVLGSEAGCEASVYFDSFPTKWNTLLGCDGSSVLLGSFEDVSWYLSTHLFFILSQYF
jgi:hypothetical protein